MSQALVAAARDTGIRLTLLPVLYMAGGFDGRALGERQKRFGHDLDGYLRLFESLHVRQDERLRVGCALHSLRSEEHTSELQSLMRISYAVFCLKKKKPHI